MRSLSSMTSWPCCTENAASGAMYATGSLPAKLREGIGSSASTLAAARFASAALTPSMAARPP